MRLADPGVGVGLLLIGAAIVAMIVANSPLALAYAAVLHRQAGPLTIAHWIDDGLMAIFFFTVGLEVKRELVAGELSRPGSRLLPVSAAICGMIVPALVYLSIAGRVPGLARGWAVPAATDIAFAQAVLLIAGRGAPSSLRIFLTTLAIIDDIGAIAIIAIAYTAALDLVMLVAALAIVAALWLLGRRGVDRAWPYLLLGVLLWVAILRSGVHPTVAGVLAALTIPAGGARAREEPLLIRLERALHPWVVYGVLPLFALANAGLSLRGIGPAALLAPLPLAIALGLFAGKQLGVGIGMAVPIMLGLASRPAGTGVRHLHAVAALAGIGFTMSLFIGGLAFADPVARDAVKLGVLAGSILSALSGYLLLRTAPPCQPEPARA